jgi:malonate-semialdehyde dehydrogenase (acetylating)/methylmalonate-semialdehyde dehydrogenase
MDDFASKDHRRSTVRALVGAAFGAAGQRCMALSVVILVGGKEDADAWVEEMVGQAGGLKVGNGFVEGVDVGEFVRNLSLPVFLAVVVVFVVFVVPLSPF